MPEYRLIIAGRAKGGEDYWAGILAKINDSPVRDKFLLRIEFVPDAETEIYFKAADKFWCCPTRTFFRAGCCFWDTTSACRPSPRMSVGSLKEEIVEGRTGSVFPTA